MFPDEGELIASYIFPAVDDEEIETKVVRRGRPKTPKATEGAETK